MELHKEIISQKLNLCRKLITVEHLWEAGIRPLVLNTSHQLWQIERFIAEAEKVSSALSLEIMNLIESNADARPEIDRLSVLSEKLLDLRYKRAMMDSGLPETPALMCA